MATFFGDTKSRAETYVNMCIQAAISVINNTVAVAEGEANKIVNVDLSFCENLKDVKFDIDQSSTFNLKAASEALNRSDLATDVKSAVNAAANSEAKAGVVFGAESRSKVVTDVTDQITTTVMNETKSIAHAMDNQEFNFKAPHCKNWDGVIVIVNQKSNVVAESFAKSESMTLVRESLVAEVVAATKSTAIGFDPTLIVLAVLAIVAIIFLGPALFGMKVLFSPMLWFCVGLGVIAIGVYLDISTATHTWPSGSDDSSSKKNNMLIGGSVTAGVGTLLSGITGYMMFKKKPVAPKL